MNEYRQRYEKKAALIRAEKAGCMSDTKWCKLLNSIISNEEYKLSAKVKLLADEQIYPFSLTIGVNKPGTGTMDGDVGGPVIFKDIEWLYFYPSELNRADSVIKLEALLGSLGKFEYDFDGKSIKLYGYK